MPVSNDIKESRAKLKGAPFKDKFQYFMDYYKWPTLGIILGIVLVIYFIHDIILANKPVYLEVVLLNSTSIVDGEQISKEFSEAIDVSLDDYQINIDTTTTMIPNSTDEISYTNSQRIFASIVAGDLDVIVADEAMFHYYSNQEAFSNLTEVLTEEQIARYQGRFIYQTYDEEIGEIPIGIDITGIPYLTFIGGYVKYEAVEDPEDDQIIFGFVVNSLDTQHASEYLDYMFSITEDYLDNYGESTTETN